MDIAAVHVHIVVRNGEQVAADEVGGLVRQSSKRSAWEDPVQVFAVFGYDEFAARPEALDIDRVQQDQAAVYMLRLNVPAQFYGCGDARIFAAVDAGGDQQGGAVFHTVDYRQGYFRHRIGNRQHGPQLGSPFNFQSANRHVL